METAQSQILGKLKGRASTAHEKVKDVEGKAGGRVLPGGLKDAVATITGVKLGEYQSGQSSGEPYLFVYATCVAPPEFAGINLGVEMMYALTESMFASEEENLAKLYSDMKLCSEQLGDQISRASSTHEALAAIYETLDDKTKPPISFLFNTSNRQKKSGTYTVFIQGPAESAPVSSSEGNGEPTSQFKIGDRVNVVGNFFDDNTDYAGVIRNVESQTCNIKFDDDGSFGDVPHSNIELLNGEPAAEEPAEEPVQFETGDVVLTPKDYFGDGETWQGTIAETKGDQATVEFEDESTEKFSFDQLSLPE